jgi:exocyst complex component 1
VVKPIQEVSPDGPVVLPSAVTEIESEGTVERDLVSQAEEEDMEALLGTYVLFFIFYCLFFCMAL